MPRKENLHDTYKNENLPPCTIDWGIEDIATWQAIISDCRRVPLTQSYNYARAVCPLYGQRARWGEISIDGHPAGIVQIQEAGVFRNLIHGLILDRGPVWRQGYGAAAHQKAFFQAFANKFPRRVGRRRRIIPEVPDTSDMRVFLNQQGYHRYDTPGYKTIWLDLTSDLDNLRQDMHKKWRYALRKAENTDLTVDWDHDGACLPWLLNVYKQDKQEKGYDGPSVGLIKALAKTFIPDNRFIIGRALIEKTPVAAILVLCHGPAATYQIGWINDKGKRINAHNFLLWQVLPVLQRVGIKDFDLGGINDQDAKGVKRFKKRMGGDKVTLAGQYR